MGQPMPPQQYQQYPPQRQQPLVTLPYQFLLVGSVQQPVFSPENLLAYNVKGRPAFSYVDIYLNPGQKVVADAGKMLWMDGEVPMKTHCPGGCMNSTYRTCSGESCFQNTFTGPGKVSLGSEMLGDLLPFVVTQGNGWVITRSSYICGTENLKVTSRFSGCGACLCGREGAFLTHVTVLGGTGMFFGGHYGMLERNEVAAGQQLIVDGGLFFAAHELSELAIGIVGGCTGLCFSGEGFVIKFTGPCVVYTKSRDYERLLAMKKLDIEDLKKIAESLKKVVEVVSKK